MSYLTQISGGLRKRCPCCGKVRKRREPPGDQGGERHPRRPPWILTPFGLGCGWCFIKYAGISPKPAETLRDRVIAAARAAGLKAVV